MDKDLGEKVKIEIDQVYTEERRNLQLTMVVVVHPSPYVLAKHRPQVK